MKHKGFDNMLCPIARSLEHVGEWWSILILRDAFKGATRFDQFEKSLGIAPNMLTRRLGALVESGLLERRLYSEKPPRHEYVLTERGKDFRPVLWALVAWGNKHFQPQGETMIVVDSETGEPAEPVLIDARSGRVLRGPDFKIVTVRSSDERMPRPDAGGGQDARGASVSSGDEGTGAGRGASAAKSTGGKRQSAKRKNASTSS
jgi:DNA-binding HxlR family transcriptional regulator